MRYGSVCSGIEAASVAWEPLGWSPKFFSEIEPFCCRLLQQHFSSVPNFGDMTKHAEWPDVSIDLLVGGTPCQAFSVAGLRQGLADPRGNLALVYLAVLARYRPRWVVWENVPGVLSSSDGRDFGAFLGALGQLGYGFAYRVLDAQHFGVPQRRRRVFVVGYLGDWRRPAAVLFERQGVCGHTEAGNKIRKNTSFELAKSTGEESTIAFSFRDNGRDATLNLAPTCRAQESSFWGGNLAISVSLRGREGGATAELSGNIATALRASQGGGDKPFILTDRVRRLTPRECERLQGFPDDWTAIPQASDSARYKAIGNSMAVPVMRWIGRRIDVVDAATRSSGG